MLHRPARDTDIPALHRIYSSDSVSPYVAFDRGDEAMFMGVVRRWQSAGEVIVAEERGEVIGAYVLQRRTDRLAHSAYIGSVGVAPEHQGRGVGSAMMREAINRLRAEGRHRIELYVSADNPRAISMYGRLGFEIEGTHRRFFRRAGEDAFVDEHSMALLLPTNAAAQLGSPASGHNVHQPIDRASAPHYTWGDRCDGWHLVRTSGLSVIEERMPPGAREVRHYHAAARQFFRVLTGTLTMEVDGATHDLRAGEGLEIAPGRAHQAQNRSDDPVEFLVISTPPSHGDRHAPRE
ncbi:MAG: GNAT family N-acetyltransferase [Phycisphaerales bacterium]